MKNKIFLVILMSIFVCYQTIAQTDIKTDSLKNKKSSDLNLFPIKSGEINQMPFNSINSLSMLNPSAYYLKGGRMFFYGIEATGDYIYIDGMQVGNANDFPFRSIGSYYFYGLSSPIKMGNSLAGFINNKPLKWFSKLQPSSNPRLKSWTTNETLNNLTVLNGFMK